jgi:hypothetical protein
LIAGDGVKKSDHWLSMTNRRQCSGPRASRLGQLDAVQGPGGTISQWVFRA